MVSLGLSDDVIIEKIRSVKATSFDTSVEGLKSLKAANVSDAVLKAMINPHVSSTGTKKTADQGNGVAENNLGSKYMQGLGVDRDYQQALVLFRRAADQHNSSAESNLGSMYEHGLGVPQDYQQAVSWYRKAAEQGNVQAQNQLGILYKDGNGVPRDDLQSVVWFRKAANQGDGNAELNLGWMYANGRGVAQDYEQALSWYRKAADQGSEDVQRYLDELPSAVRERGGQPVSISNPQSAAASNKVTITGVVEAIIGSGDLKPARFAKVFAGPQQMFGELSN